MTVVIGTAGHIDHGKTRLLQALTGIDADRLPEEQRRGLTIDVGYAHGAPDDGPEVDFVDVPGHDRLVGNMLVGVGEVDACLLVVAADDGPRAQTLEHLGLLDAMGLREGVVAVTKIDLVDEARFQGVATEVRALVEATTLAGAPIVAVSAASGAGLDELSGAVAALRDRVERVVARRRDRPPWLAIDRVFKVPGRGIVVTGSSRGRAIVVGDRLARLPGDVTVRVRGLHVHDSAVERGPEGGRVALQLAGADGTALRRGQVLMKADGPGPSAVGSDRLLVALRPPPVLPGRGGQESWPPRHAGMMRLHIGTEQADAVLGRSGRDSATLPDGRAIAVLRLDHEVAARVGEPFVLRRPPPAGLLAGGIILDPEPPRGRSRRRQTSVSLSRLAAAVDAGEEDGVVRARLELHGLLRLHKEVLLAPDVRAVAQEAALEAISAHHRDHPDQVGLSLPAVRAVTAAAIRRSATARKADAALAADDVVVQLLASGSLDRAGDAVRSPDHRAPGPDPERAAAMDRLVAALDAAAPPPLTAAAAAAGCPPDALRELEDQGRIVIVDDDLAWSAAAYDELRRTALRLAVAAPLAPAALRDASGTSRKYVMALLEDLDRRGILRRTTEGHVPGPMARVEG